jgi:hypothetical protein
MRSDAADFMHLRADLSRCIAGKSGAINYLIILRAKAAHCQGAAPHAAAAAAATCDSRYPSGLFVLCSRYNLCAPVLPAGRSLALAARTFALCTAAVQLCAFNVIISAITLTCRAIRRVWAAMRGV